MWVTWVTTPYTACLAAYVGYYHTLCYHIHTYFHTLPYITCLSASLHSYLCGLLATIHFLATVAAIFYTLPPWLVACSPWLLLLIHCLHCCCYHTLPPLPGLLIHCLHCLLPYIASIAWAIVSIAWLPYIAWATVATMHCLHGRLLTTM